MCTSPMYGRWLPSEGKYKITSRRWTGEPIYHPKDIAIPCGGCYECRLEKSRQWADRMMLELDHSKTAVFVTLTYSPDFVPVSMLDDNDECIFTLNKRDVQLFLKRLRKRFEPREIRYYLCGEYGDTTNRPHYHAIIYGLSLSDFPDSFTVHRNDYNQYIYCSPMLAEIWGKGYASIANVSWQTCAYVARYTMKKLSGDMADIYALRQQQPPFALMSRKPGIAGYYPREHPDCYSKSYLYTRDDFGVTPRTKMRVPSYIFHKLSLTNPALYDKIKSERRLSAKLSMDNQLADTDLGFVEYLESKADESDVRARKLPRNKI